jgi:cytoskeleton protein RodZ
MATDTGRDRAPGIGSVLKQARERQGIDLNTVEERTKIRLKYLRALEDEDWDVLPNPAYARAFLRAYAELLGLDGEVLVDDYRRGVEEAASDLQSLSEPLLEGRPRMDRRRVPRLGRGPLIALGLAGVVVVLLVIGLLGGGGDGDQGAGGKHAGKPNRQRRAQDRGGKAPGVPTTPPGAPKTVTVKLRAHTDTQVCLLDAQNRVLDPGQAKLLVNGRRSRVATLSTEPAAYQVTPAGVSHIAFTGPTCP